MPNAAAPAQSAASGVVGCGPGPTGRILVLFAANAALSDRNLTSFACQACSARHCWRQPLTLFWIWVTMLCAPVRLLAAIVWRIIPWLLAATWLSGRLVRWARLDRLIPARFWLTPRKT